MKVTIVTSEDSWEGLYVNGHLVVEQHHIRISDLMDALDIDYRLVEANEEVLNEFEVYPENEEDLVTI